MVKPAAKPSAAAADAAAAFAKTSPGGQGQRCAEWPWPGGNCACPVAAWPVIKALSLKEALLVVKRAELLPQVLESAVLDLEQGEAAAQTARLNGYLHAVAALEPKPDSEWLR